MLHLWRCHSRTIVCLVLGSALTSWAWNRWPDGGNAWDFWGGVGTVLVGFGLEGIVNIWTETNKAEE